ncbi:hypothetical protein Tco_1132107 [Tanacetum coccineum]|uniref:Uncharacterized protein n=1 Tax=Tanacetum coccineum TaxID=301880 RepID=A0ABQ5JC27_9ASTR
MPARGRNLILNSVEDETNLRWLILSLKSFFKSRFRRLQQKTFRLDAETEIETIRSRHHQYLLDTEAQNVSTAVIWPTRVLPVFVDAVTPLHPNHHPVSIWDSEEVLVHQVVSMKKMNEKPGHVRPANDFYAKLNALMFVPQKDLSGDQAYWLSANEIASQASKSATPATPFVRKSRPPSQVLAVFRNVNAVFPNLKINIMKVLNVGSTESSCDQQALETNRIQLKDTITSLRIQLDGLKVENVRMYPTVQKYVHSKRAIGKQPVAKKKQTKLPLISQTYAKATLGNHRILPSKSVNARRAADHNRKLNVVDHNQFVIRSLKSVNTKTPQAKHSVNHTKKVWKATRNHNVNTTKTAWRPTRKVVDMEPLLSPLNYTLLPLLGVKQMSPETLKELLDESVSESKGRTVADSIAERLTRPTAYKFKTDCSIIPVWDIRGTSLSRAGKPVKKVLLMNLSDHRYEHVKSKVSGMAKFKVERKSHNVFKEVKLKQVKDQDQVITSNSEDHDQVKYSRHIFNILNQTSTAQEIWNNVELLMQGSGRTLQQRKGRSLVNDMKITQLEIPTHQMNTKFVNNLPAYWGNFHPPTTSSGLPPTKGLMITVHDGQFVLNQFKGGSSVKKPRERWTLSTSKIKLILMEAQSERSVLDAETWMKGPIAAVAFMGLLLSQEMHQEEHLDSDAETEIDDNTIPYHQYLLDTEAQLFSFQTEVLLTPLISIYDCHLTELANPTLDGLAKVNQENVFGKSRP